MQKAEDSSDDSSQGDESEDDSVATFAKPNPTRKTGPKAWVVLFKCATTRAIHLEVVTDMKMESFWTPRVADPSLSTRLHSQR